MEKQYRMPPEAVADELRGLASIVQQQAGHAFVKLSEMKGWEEKGRAFLIDLRWEFKPKDKQTEPTVVESEVWDSLDGIEKIEGVIEKLYRLAAADFFEDGTAIVKYIRKPPQVKLPQVEPTQPSPGIVTTTAIGHSDQLTWWGWIKSWWRK